MTAIIHPVDELEVEAPFAPWPCSVEPAPAFAPAEPVDEPVDAPAELLGLPDELPEVLEPEELPPDEPEELPPALVTA